MTIEEFHERVRGIVADAKALKDRHTEEAEAPVNYACIFCQSQEEYEALLTVVQTFGKVVKDTKAGPVFQIEPLDTVAGPLRLLKIRKPDAEHPERGDADFTVADYPAFKAAVLVQPGFKLITRPKMEMTELTEPGARVRTYFSHPSLDQQLL